MGVYNTKDELRRSELRLGIVGRGEGVDKLDVWLDLCRTGILAKESHLSNLFKGFGGVSLDYGFHTQLLSSPGYTRTIQKSSIVKVGKNKTREERVVDAVNLFYEQIQFLVRIRHFPITNSGLSITPILIHPITGIMACPISSCGRPQSATGIYLMVCCFLIDSPVRVIR